MALNVCMGMDWARDVCMAHCQIWPIVRWPIVRVSWSVPAPGTGLSVYAWCPMLMPMQDMAEVYVRHHFQEFLRYYHAAHADARSPAAEVCRLHLRLLLAAVGTQSRGVRAELQRLGAVEVLLEEFSLEATLYSVETAQVRRHCTAWRQLR